MRLFKSGTKPEVGDVWFNKARYELVLLTDESGGWFDVKTITREREVQEFDAPGSGFASDAMRKLFRLEEDITRKVLQGAETALTRDVNVILDNVNTSLTLGIADYRGQPRVHFQEALDNPLFSLARYLPREEGTTTQHTPDVRWTGYVQNMRISGFLDLASIAVDDIFHMGYLQMQERTEQAEERLRATGIQGTFPVTKCKSTLWSWARRQHEGTCIDTTVQFNIVHNDGNEVESASLQDIQAYAHERLDKITTALYAPNEF